MNKILFASLLLVFPATYGANSADDGCGGLAPRTSPFGARSSSPIGIVPAQYSGENSPVNGLGRQASFNDRVSPFADFEPAVHVPAPLDSNTGVPGFRAYLPSMAATVSMVSGVFSNVSGVAVTAGGAFSIGASRLKEAAFDGASAVTSVTASGAKKAAGVVVYGASATVSGLRSAGGAFASGAGRVASATAGAAKKVDWKFVGAVVADFGSDLLKQELIDRAARGVGLTSEQQEALMRELAENAERERAAKSKETGLNHSSKNTKSNPK